MRMVTAKDLFFAAVGRGHEYSANIEDFLINKIEHLPKSKYFYLEKKKNPKIHISFLKKIPKHCLFSRFQVYIKRYIKGSFHPRKLDLRQKQIILLSRIAILLLKGYFEREKINFHEKNLKHRKIILLINFIFDPTFFLIASYQKSMHLADNAGPTLALLLSELDAIVKMTIGLVQGRYWAKFRLKVGKFKQSKKAAVVGPALDRCKQ